MPVSPPKPPTSSPSLTTPIVSEGILIKFSTSPNVGNILDADDDEGEEHRYQTLDNILVMDVVLVLAHHDVVQAELHSLGVEEPKSLKEVHGEPHWAMAVVI